MKTRKQKHTVTVQKEVDGDFVSLNLLIEGLIAYNPQTRKAAADCVKNWDFGRHNFTTHVGGHHVGILLFGRRVALVTGTWPDWN